MESNAEGTWVPENMCDAAWYIFKKLFMCRVKNIDSMSPEYIRMFGSPDSGDSVIDQETANELVIRMLSINEMVEYFRNGVVVHVVNYSDTKEIYERISNHLNAWKLKIEREFHVRDAPVADLVLLDKFASTVYKHAVTLFDNTYADSILARQTSQLMKFNRQNILKQPDQVNPVTNEIVHPERLSMAESFDRSYPKSKDIERRWR